MADIVAHWDLVEPLLIPTSRKGSVTILKSGASREKTGEDNKPLQITRHSKSSTSKTKLPFAKAYLRSLMQLVQAGITHEALQALCLGSEACLVPTEGWKGEKIKVKKYKIRKCNIK
jgi:hypothetical protein